jgi:hypothetical protein
VLITSAGAYRAELTTSDAYYFTEVVNVASVAVLPNDVIFSNLSSIDNVEVFGSSVIVVEVSGTNLSQGWLGFIEKSLGGSRWEFASVFTSYTNTGFGSISSSGTYRVSAQGTDTISMIRQVADEVVYEPLPGTNVYGQFGGGVNTNTLTFDGYDKLTVGNTSVTMTTYVQLGSETYNLGDVSELFISKSGTYTSFSVDSNGLAAYLGSVIVSAVMQDVEFGFEETIPGYATPTGNNSMGSAINFNADGTRMVVGMGHYNNYYGRAAVYHLENGIWTRHVDIPSPVTSIKRFGDHVYMSYDGTRILVNQ